MEPPTGNVPQNVYFCITEAKKKKPLSLLALLLLAQVYFQDEQKEKAMYVK
jgi:hypothetical protein